MTIDQIILMARQQNCSDIHLTEGASPVFRIHGQMKKADFTLEAAECAQMIRSMLNETQRKNLEEGRDADFAVTSTDGNRQRVNVFRQQGKLAATIRLLNSHIPTLEALKLPSVLRELSEKPRGLILVTGPTGSGKSTTLAAMVDHINETQSRHIITIEDPVEYVYQTKKCLIHQREVGMDTRSFADALRSSLREDPDVILVGEMRDYETMSAALTAAETGHLVLSTLHTTGAAQTVDRIVDACPSGTQNQIRIQLAGVLNGIITQCLIPLVGGNGRIAATEILTGTDAVLNLVREGKAHQMGSTMQAGAAFGMHTLNADLCRLVRQGMITADSAYRYSNDRKDLEQYL
jgi:twitching motility protein PilT